MTEFRRESLHGNAREACYEPPLHLVRRMLGHPSSPAERKGLDSEIEAVS